MKGAFLSLNPSQSTPSKKGCCLIPSKVLILVSLEVIKLLKQERKERKEEKKSALFDSRVSIDESQSREGRKEKDLPSNSVPTLIR